MSDDLDPMPSTQFDALEREHERQRQEAKREGFKPYCACKSGEYREAQYDGYGIFLTYTCVKCEASKLSHYRRDIRDAYDCDEPIDSE